MDRCPTFPSVIWRYSIHTVVACATFTMSGIAQESVDGSDSARNEIEWVITPRLNSAGHFPFTGSLINRNINADINIFVEGEKWGFFLFKSHDLQEEHSLINYLQPGVFRIFRFNETVKVRMFFGYLFSQVRSFRDPDSDFYTAPVAYWTVSPRVSVENCALLYDLTTNAKLANRFLILWSIGKFRFDFYVWHRWVFQSHEHATSAGLAMNLPQVKLAHSVKIAGTVSYQGYLSTAKPDYARQDGLLVSVAVPISLKD